MTACLEYPFDADTLLRKKRALRRSLAQRSDLLPKRIAILGGSTTAEIKDILELFLLQGGIRPQFYESEYNRYYEDVMFPNEVLEQFAPEIIYIHTTGQNIGRFPSVSESEAEIEALLAAEMSRYLAIWERITATYSCPIIQNNFELPHFRGVGNLDGYDIHGRSRFVAELNARFAKEARSRGNLYLNDINYLSAWFGLERWHDRLFWYSYKYALSYEAIPLLADNVASIVKAILGMTKKCLVVDLDNTLWGGVIGDDGLQGISIGKETPEAEAYAEFQQYVKSLKERGIILAVCSKNDEANAREGFSHPDSVLADRDFSVFLANWDPKHENVVEIARTLNIGLDSLVFADDNPAEREIVRAHVPQVAVPELGSDIARYITVLDKTGYFATASLSADDLKRSTFYAENALRNDLHSRFENYEDFLRSLEMVAEIKPFAPIYLDRITQLTNKTNQFNLTTRRYTFDEIQSMASSDDHVTLYGRLADKFGDNGLVSVIAGSVQGASLHIDLWLMSCRVLKRGMEAAMLDQLVVAAKARGLTTLWGYYVPTAKNGMVSGMYQEMGFRHVETREDKGTVWSLDIPSGDERRNLLIEVNA